MCRILLEQIKSWLVVWNIVIFPYIGNFIIPTDELIFFRGVGLNHQPESLGKTGLVEAPLQLRAAGPRVAEVSGSLGLWQPWVQQSTHRRQDYGGACNQQLKCRKCPDLDQEPKYRHKYATAL